MASLISYYSNLLVNHGCTHQTMRGEDHEFVPVGQGNVVSVEFNLLYRWHSALSVKDVEWTTKMFEELVQGGNPSEVKKKVLFPF